MKIKNNNNKMEKATHAGYKTELFMPIMQSAEGKYIAVLSDDSTDRDDEFVSSSCIREMAKDNNYLAAMCNHNNDIFMMVADWRNKRVEEIDGHTALIAEPYFYKSNPNAKIIMGMLNEGAKPGISIGAMVKDYEEVNGKRMYTELEIVEASFVGIPSNRHGRAMAVAKNFNKVITIKANKEGGIRMEKEFTQKDIDLAIEKKVEEMKVEVTKQLEEKDSEIVKIKEEVSLAKKESEEALEKFKVDEEKKIEEITLKHKEELEKAKKVALEKQNFTSNEGVPTGDEDVEKEFKAGKIPVMRM